MKYLNLLPPPFIVLILFLTNCNVLSEPKPGHMEKYIKNYLYLKKPKFYFRPKWKYLTLT